MNTENPQPPVILSFSAHDPSGAGGIQADIETAASLGCHCAAVITAMCAEGATPDTETISVDATLIIEQARSVLESMDVKAIKIGFLGSSVNAEAVHSILRDYPHIPVVSHPALCLFDEENTEHVDLPAVYSTLIIPVSSVTIFTMLEARRVSNESDTVDTTGNDIIAGGCEWALITGVGKNNRALENCLYGDKGLTKKYIWNQDMMHCHGSGSTLAMSAAAYMAHGSEAKQAIEQAQNFTLQAMRHARQISFGRKTPHRFFWADKNIDLSAPLPADKKIH